jgi:AcrR family transcriptional regulator/DNA-binding MarR family transcriptional regulator
MPARKRQADVGAGEIYEQFARSQVIELQRARILSAMVEECCERGVGGVSVAHVVSRSGVSRRTFYDVFSDREDCFAAAFERALSLARTRVLDASESQGSWRERVRAGLVALLGFLEDEPRLARVLVCESAAGGPRVLARRAETIEQLARMVDEGRGESKGAAELSPLTAEGVVGGALAVIGARLLAQSDARGAARKARTRPLLELAGPLMSTIVLPYLGPAAARKELTRPLAHHAPRTLNGSPATGAMLPADPFKDAGMRLTYRTVRVLMAIAQHPQASNREIGTNADIADQGQISKLLNRLKRIGLIENTGIHPGKGAPNSWALTEKGRQIAQSIRTNTTEETR